MTSKEALARLVQALRAERRRFWGEIAAREERIGQRCGYFREVLNRPHRLTLQALLEVLETFEVDVPRFFARVFELGADPVELLRELEDTAATASGERLEAVLSALAERDPEESSDAAPVDVAKLLVNIDRCPRYERARRLRLSPNYRHPAFVRAWLERLDDLRYDRPRDAAKLAEVVAVDLIPHLAGPRAELLTLACEAVGVFASARRMTGDHATAARALRCALETACRHQLDEAVAPLLQRGAYLLLDHAQYDRALLLLREAWEIYSDLGDQVGIGKTLVDRGIMLDLSGKYQRAVRVFRSALKYLDAEQPKLLRNRLAAYNGLAISYRNLGRPDEAERALRQAASLAQQTDQVTHAKVLWLRGTILCELKKFPVAERLFLQARAAMNSVGNHLEEALVCLDLASLLVAQGRRREACELAKGMAALLSNFKGNNAFEAALLEFIKLGLRGEIEQVAIARAAEQLRAGAHPTRVREHESG